MNLLPAQTAQALRLAFLPAVAGVATSREERHMRRLFHQAEHFLRRQRPDQALALLQARSVPPQTWPLCWHPCWYLLVGWALLQQNQPRQARSVFKQGLKILKRLLRHCGARRRAGLSEWREWLHYFLGVSWYIDGQPVQALFHHRLALRAITDGVIRDPELVMLIHKGLGDVYLSLGAPAEAIGCFRRAKQYGQDVTAPDTEALLAWSLGLAYQSQGDFRRASLAFSAALRLVEQLDAKLLVSRLQSLLGQVHIRLQHHGAAETLLRQALGSAERLGDPVTRAMALLGLAALHLARGKPDKAIRATQDGLATLQETKDHQIIGQLFLTLARAFEAQGNLGAAEEALLSAISTLQQVQQYGLIVRAHEHYGAFLAGQGRFQEAYEQLRTAPYRTAASLARQVVPRPAPPGRRGSSPG
jgi:tetratricopeptide (TPR) repeat protein